MDNGFLQSIHWLKWEIFGNSIYSYIIALAVFSIVWGGVHFLWSSMLRKIKAISDRLPEDLYNFILSIIRKINPLLFPLVAFYLAVKRLSLGAYFEKFLTYAVFLLIVLQVVSLCGTAISYLVSKLSIGRGDDQLVVDSTRKNLTLTLKIVVWVAGVLFLLDNFGINISTVITGLGIGGIAVALAAQTILGDTFSSFTIALDKPFEVGDAITVDDLAGTVEHIGLKTTRVRSIGGELLIFSNSDLTKARIKNYKKMETKRVNFKIGLTYDTPDTKLKMVPGLIKKIIEATEKTKFDRAHFFSYGDFALVFDIVYFVLDRDYGVYMDVQQEINFKIREVFSQHGIEFAFPTQTLHISK